MEDIKNMVDGDFLFYNVDFESKIFANNYYLSISSIKMSDTENKEREFNPLDSGEKIEEKREETGLMGKAAENENNQGQLFQKKQIIFLNRPSKLINSPSQKDITVLRSAKSGSIKAKLNLENTKLKVNIQNLNVTLKLKEQNEINTKKQLEKYMQKVKKYKDRVKQKDLIIVKLMNKIEKEKKQPSDSFIKEESEFIKLIRERGFQGNQSEKTLFERYERIFSKFVEGQQKRKDLMEENEQYISIVNKLKKGEEVEFTGLGSKKGEIQLEDLKLKYRQNEEQLHGMLKTVTENESKLREQLQLIHEKIREIEDKNGEYEIIESQILKTKEQLAYLTTQYGQETKNWMQIQNSLEEKIDELKQRNYILEERNDTLERKCHEFDIKIKSYLNAMIDEESNQSEMLAGSSDNNILQLQQIQSASSKLKKDNLNLSQKLESTQKKYQELVNEQEKKWEEISFELKNSDNMSKKIQLIGLGREEQLKETKKQQIQLLKGEVEQLKSELEKQKAKVAEMEVFKMEAEHGYQINVMEKSSEKDEEEDELEKSASVKSIHSESEAYVIKVKSPEIEDEEYELDELRDSYKELKILSDGIKEKNVKLQKQVTKLKQQVEPQSLAEIEQKQEEEEIMRETYQNINEQIERLSQKCEEIEKQKEELYAALDGKDEQINKLKNHNEDLTVLVMNLEEQCGKYREKDYSMSNQREGQKSKLFNQSSSLKEQHESELNKITNEFNEIVGEIGEGNYANNYKIKDLEDRIKEMRISLEEIDYDKMNNSGEKNLTQSLRKECRNCETLAQKNKQLLKRISILEGSEEFQILGGQKQQNNREIEMMREETAKILNQEKQANRQLVQKIDKYLKQKETVERELTIKNKLFEEKQNQLKGLYVLVGGKQDEFSKVKANLEVKEELDKRIRQLIEENQQLNSKLIEIVHNYQKIDAYMKDQGYEAIEEIMEEKNIAQQKYNCLLSQLEQNHIHIEEDSENKALVIKSDQVKQLAEENTQLKKHIEQMKAQQENIVSQNKEILQNLQNLQNTLLQRENRGQLGRNEEQSPEKSNNVTIQGSNVRSLNLNNHLEELQKLTNDFNSKISSYEDHIQKIEKQLDQSNKKNENQEKNRDCMNQEIQRLILCVDQLNDHLEPEFIVQKQDGYEKFTELISKLKIKLQIYKEVAMDKTNKMNELFQQMKKLSLQCIKEGSPGEQQIEQAISHGNNEDVEQKLQQAAIIEERYEELIAGLVTYEDLNKDFSNKLNYLKNKTVEYKNQIQSSDDVPYSQQILRKMIAEEQSRQLHPILKVCLGKISELQRNLELLQLDFDRKNRKLDVLLKKQISFQSDRERRKSHENSLDSKKEELLLYEMEETDPKKGKPFLVEEKQKNSSFASIKVFKEIQELSKVNEELKEKLYIYKNLVEQSQKVLLQLNLESLNAEEGKNIGKLLKIFKQEIWDENKDKQQKKQSSIFDLDEDYIVSGSFKQKIKKSQQNLPLQQIQVTFEAKKVQIGVQTVLPDQGIVAEQKGQAKLSEILEKQESDQKNLFEKKMKFLREHKVFIDGFLQKMKEIEEYENIEEEKVYTVLAESLNQDQLQKLIFMEEYSEAIKKIIQLLQANGNNSKQLLSLSAVLNRDIEDIIKSIYPQKSYLCDLVHNSILKLLSTENNDEFLEIIYNLFHILQEEEQKMSHLLNRKDSCIRDYGVKMQKVLLNKFSEDSGTENSDLLLESSFKKITQFKTQYDFRRQEPEDQEGLEKQEQEDDD